MSLFTFIAMKKKMKMVTVTVSVVNFFYAQPLGKALSKHWTIQTHNWYFPMNKLLSENINSL